MRCQAAYNAFLGLLSNYQVLSPEEEAESSSMANGAMPVDPARKREAKIRQYRREKDLRGSISVSQPSGCGWGQALGLDMGRNGT